MIIQDNTESKRELLGMCLDGRIKPSQIKQLDYNDDIEYLHRAIKDKINYYLFALQNATVKQVRELLRIKRLSIKNE